jgi:hypothetical protein
VEEAKLGVAIATLVVALAGFLGVVATLSVSMRQAYWRRWADVTKTVIDKPQLM